MIKKISAVILALIFSCVPLLFSLAADPVIIQSYLSQPVASDCYAYFINGSDYSNARMYVFYANVAQGHIEVEQDFSNGNYAFYIKVRFPDGSLASNYPIWIGRYNVVNGTCYDLKYYPSSGMIGSTHYLETSRSYNDMPYIWFTGNVTVTNYNGVLVNEDYNTNFFSITWEGQGQGIDSINNNIQQQIFVLSNIYNNSSLSLQELDDIRSLIINNWSWFKNTFYNYIYDQWYDTNYILMHIYTLLGGNETVPTYENDTELESNVNEYHDSESRLFEEYDRYDGVAETLFSDASQQLGSFSNSFLFIRNIFDTFIPQGSLPVRLKNFFTLHRHTGNDIIYMCQDWSRVDKTIRAVTFSLWYIYTPVLPFFRRFSIAKRIYRNININEYTSELTLGYRFAKFTEILFSKCKTTCYRPKWYKYFDSFDKLQLDNLPEFNYKEW